MTWLNRRPCVVNEYGRVSIFYQIEDPRRPGFRRIERLTEWHFRRLYRDKQAAWFVPWPTMTNPKATKLVTRSWAVWWLGWEGRRTYHEQPPDLIPEEGGNHG
jgi:hypothetical protein